MAKTKDIHTQLRSLFYERAREAHADPVEFERRMRVIRQEAAIDNLRLLEGGGVILQYGGFGKYRGRR